MKQFYNLVKKMFYQPLHVQQSSSSFLQTMENALHKRQLVGKKRLGKNTNANMQQIMQAKPGSKTPKAEQQCNHEVTSTKWTSDNLAKMKETHCKGSNHLDLSTTNIKNIASKERLLFFGEIHSEDHIVSFLRSVLAANTASLEGDGKMHIVFEHFSLEMSQLLIRFCRRV